MDSQEAETLESLLFRLSTLRAATEDFSELHKLGEGGFGSVYRVINSRKKPCNLLLSLMFR